MLRVINAITDLVCHIGSLAGAFISILAIIERLHMAIKHKTNKNAIKHQSKE